jgi:hypothetical protein
MVDFACAAGSPAIGRQGKIKSKECGSSPAEIAEEKEKNSLTAPCEADSISINRK